MDSKEVLRPDHWYSPGEAARCLSVTTKTLQRWSEAGRITVLVLPTNRRRYLRADIDAIAAQRQEAIAS